MAKFNTKTLRIDNKGRDVDLKEMIDKMEITVRKKDNKELIASYDSVEGTIIEKDGYEILVKTEKAREDTDKS